jgi:hypothetical protein
VTERIRWEDNGYGGQCGYVGTLKPWAFQIWRPDPESEHSRLDSTLPGQFARCAWSDGSDLKAEAERWLERFVASLGAAFPTGPVTSRCECGGLAYHQRRCAWRAGYGSQVIARADQETAVTAAGEEDR